MLNTIVKWSIAQRWLIVIASILISLWGLRVITQMPLDVFPAFAPPQVEIQVEASGLAPEEIESLVTRPIESAINGTPGLESLRSSSAIGISAIKTVFSWDTDIYRARQLVTERLQGVKLPQGVEQPEILPVSSPLGWAVKYAFSAESTDMMEVWRIVNWDVKNRLLAVPGVSNVFLYGGDERQYQVLVDPDKLKAYNVSLPEVTQAVQNANVNVPGGFLITPDQETLIRGIGRIESINQLKRSVIKAAKGTPILLEQIAEVKIGPGLRRGDGLFQGKRAVILTVSKQPAADTPTVVKAVEAAYCSSLCTDFCLVWGGRSHFYPDGNGIFAIDSRFYLSCTDINTSTMCFITSKSTFTEYGDLARAQSTSILSSSVEVFDSPSPGDFGSCACGLCSFHNYSAWVRQSLPARVSRPLFGQFNSSSTWGIPECN